MKYRIFTVLILTALMLFLLAACKDNSSSLLTAEQAQKIALEDAGLSADDVTDVHTHVGTYQNTPCYSIHITVDGVEYEFMIAAATGEILYKDDIK